jgi:hypothetical protein
MIHLVYSGTRKWFTISGSLNSFPGWFGKVPGWLSNVPGGFSNVAASAGNFPRLSGNSVVSSIKSFFYYKQCFTNQINIKIMKKSFYLPKSDNGRRSWLNNFSSQLTSLGAGLAYLPLRSPPLRTMLLR